MLEDSQRSVLKFLFYQCMFYVCMYFMVRFSVVPILQTGTMCAGWDHTTE